MKRWYEYCLFGLQIRSEIELPELEVGVVAGEPDVLVELGEVATGADLTAGFTADEKGAYLSVPGVARYQVDRGSRILVQPDRVASVRNVRLYLLGSVMGVLLHQRGLLPLHANAVEIDGRAVAFMGRSGAGKSTLAAWLHDHGHRILADDVCVVHFDEFNRPSVSPGLSRLRLWDDALAASGRDKSRLERSFEGDDDYRKYDVPLGAEGGGSLPIAAIYLLERGDALTMTALHGIEAVESVFANTYRGGFIRGVGSSRTHWEACLRLVREVPIFRLERPWGHDRLGAQMDQVLAHARSSTVPLQG